MTVVQHPIDLLPASVKERNRAAVRAARTVATVVAVVVITGAVSLQARIATSHAVQKLEATRRHADTVLQSEAQAARLRAELQILDEYEERYRAVALPLDVSAILATVTAQMPKGTTLDRLDIDAGARRQNRTARSRGSDDDVVPRVLTVELSGFAPSDSEVAGFILNLRSIEAFRAVSLDFSRTRLVREHPAREFRLSFRVPLDDPVLVVWVSEEDTP